MENPSSSSPLKLISKRKRKSAFESTEISTWQHPSREMCIYREPWAQMGAGHGMGHVGFPGLGHRFLSAHPRQLGI